MLPIHKAKVSVFNYEEIPAGYYHRAMLEGGAVQRFWHRKKFWEVAQRIKEGSRVLDLGCGPGSFLSVLGEARPLVTAVGVDIASRQIDYAQKEIGQKFPDGRISFRTLAEHAADLPFPAASFDVVTCIEVIEHIHPFYALKMIQDAKRVLKPGGKLIITTPNYRSFWPLIEWTLERISPVTYHEQHINQYTPNALVKFLETAGLSVAKLDSIFVLAPFVAGISRHLAEAVYAIEKSTLPRVGSLLIADAVPGSF